ncbi:hypothetical protein DB826_07865 [Xanthomonas perforans]|nr:hypothetical protein DB826_07865 [Xanthomonas perforans]
MGAVVEAAVAPAAKFGGAHWKQRVLPALIRPPGTFSREREKAANQSARPLPLAQATNPESRIPNPESRIPNPESRIPNPESRIPNPGP